MLCIALRVRLRASPCAQDDTRDSLVPQFCILHFAFCITRYASVLHFAFCITRYASCFPFSIFNFQLRRSRCFASPYGFGFGLRPALRMTRGIASFLNSAFSIFHSAFLSLVPQFCILHFAFCITRHASCFPLRVSV